ncbi:MAG: DUF4153 domain-containing protein [Gemmatimonadaceae bacterium]
MSTVPLPIRDATTLSERLVLVRLWAGAAAVAALAAGTIFNASPGLSWLMCVLVASMALIGIAREEGTAGHVAPPLALAVLVAVGMVLTARPELHAFSVLSMLVLLTVAIARSHPLRHAQAGPLALIALPAIVVLTCVAQAVRRAFETATALTGERALPLIRGIAIAIPVTGLFALLLSAADPTMAEWRESVERLFSSWDFIPRLIFFGGVLVLSLGALSYAVNGGDGKAVARGDRTPLIQLGEAERLIVLGTIAGLFTLFLTLQLRYLFGDVASIQGSGVTYAEWARQGFAELTVVATLCGGVMLGLALHAPAGAQRRRILILELIVIAETQVLLQSAFRRVLLYEEAYGFTTSRVYAQVYMVVVAASLLLLASELVRLPQARRLLGRAGALGVMALAAVSAWNHEAWIVRQNVERFALTQQLDMGYLACELSAGAVPELVRAATQVDPGTAHVTRGVIGERFAGRMNDAWYEWNVSRSRARRAIDAAGIVTSTGESSVATCKERWGTASPAAQGASSPSSRDDGHRAPAGDPGRVVLPSSDLSG